MQGTVYDKLRVLKAEVKKEFPDFNERSLFEMTAKLSCWHYPKKRTKQMKLSKYEAMLYEFYINKEYNPSTVYKWMLACNTSEEIQKKIQKGEISLKDALSRSKPYRKISQTDVEFLYHIKLSIQKYIIR